MQCSASMSEDMANSLANSIKGCEFIIARGSDVAASHFLIKIVFWNSPGYRTYKKTLMQLLSNTYLETKKRLGIGSLLFYDKYAESLSFRVWS